VQLINEAFGDKPKPARRRRSRRAEEKLCSFGALGGLIG
jgi:hypothetical protein